MAGRPRKPTAVLEDTGAFAKDPQRRAARENEPQPNGPIGEPPDYFNQTEVAIWAEFVDEAPDGVLTKADRKVLELAVRLTAKIRFQPCGLTKWFRYMKTALSAAGMPEDDIDEMEEAMETLLGVSGQEISALASCLQRMGLTPSDRSKVSVAPKPKESSFAAIAARLSAPVRPN